LVEGARGRPLLSRRGLPRIKALLSRRPPAKKHFFQAPHSPQRNGLIKAHSSKVFERGVRGKTFSKKFSPETIQKFLVEGVWGRPLLSRRGLPH
jgi:hypothetical protein